MFLVKYISIVLLALVSSLVAGIRCTNKVTKFQTADNYVGRTIDLLPTSDGRPNVIDWDWFPHCELSLIAVTESSPSGCDEGQIGCVELSLGDYSHKERVPPYSLYGDDHGDVNFDKPELGLQTLMACPYTDSRCTRGKGTCLEFELEVKDSYWPNFVLYDAALNWGGRIDYVSDGEEHCMPQSGEVTMIALYGCYVEKVDFKLTGGGRLDRFTDRQTPFWLYGNTGVYGDGDLFGRDGFELGVEYTVSAIPDDDPSRAIERRFKFKKC
jgi:hypothetical protein